MVELQLLMPMGGLGSRFKKSGHTVLKPLIEVKGAPLFWLAYQSMLHPQLKLKTTIVFKKSDEQEYKLQDKIISYIPDASFFLLDFQTRGVLETAYLAKQKFDLDLPLLILDCDLEFRSSAFLDFIIADSDESVGGALLSFSSQNGRYSYAKVCDGVVVETAEKNVISSNALVGAYYFKKAAYFFEAAEKQLGHCSRVQDESPFYIAPLYNDLIKKRQVKLFTVDSYSSFGTPEELLNV